MPRGYVGSIPISATMARPAVLMPLTESDRVELIPKTRALDFRMAVPGNMLSGVTNLRMRVTLETPPFEVALDGKAVAQQAAALIQTRLMREYAAGRDAQGRPLPPLTEATVSRRLRRQRQQDDPKNAKSDRFRVRGGRNRGRSYLPRDARTPLHESGVFAENVTVTFKGRDSGDPVFLISIPSGGKLRGLVDDDGRGARLFAAQHYGFDRIMDIPASLDKDLDATMLEHLASALQEGAFAGRQFGRLLKKAEEVVEQGAEGEVGE